MNWFEVKAKYIKIDEEGRTKTANEIYLVDALSCTEAESRVIDQLKTMVSGEFAVGKVVASNIIEIFPHETGDYWWKAKISIVAIDENYGKEKRINNFFLVSADNLKQAMERLEQGLSYILVPYQVISIALSPIVDVFPYFVESIPSNLKPIGGERVNNMVDNEEDE